MTVKSRLLELLEQHKGETLSGEDIGRELSCTRAAVWKAVNSLRQEGYPIEAGPNKGYMLTRESNLISAEGIRLFLEHPQGEVRIFDEISSTNLEARQMAVSGQAGHGSFVVAGLLFCWIHDRINSGCLSPEKLGGRLVLIKLPSGRKDKRKVKRSVKL